MAKAEPPKVVAFKSGLRSKPQRPKTSTGKTNVAAKDMDSNDAPGFNSTDEVRSAQANLLACAIEDEPSLAGEVFVTMAPEEVHDLMEMITPNTAYMTGPPSFRGREDTMTYNRDKRDARWQKLRGEHKDA